jgi:4-hydroxy-4-methyl-2-oxoglutarate aldolase
MSMTAQMDDRFHQVDAYTLADAARRRQTGGVVHSLKPQNGAARFVGRALTARVHVEPNREVPLGQYGAAALLDQVSNGHVLVLDGGGIFLSALGDLAAAIIQRRGGVAAVVNAAVRDIEDIDPGFPMFALGVAIASIASHGYITGVGEPVHIEGIRIETGDLIAGCRGGIVAIPWADREAVLQQSLALMESDRLVREGLRGGASMSEVWQQHKAPLK